MHTEAAATWNRMNKLPMMVDGNGRSKSGGFKIDRICGMIEITRLINATTWNMRIGFFESLVMIQKARVAKKVPMNVKKTTVIPLKGANSEGNPKNPLAKYKMTRLMNMETEIAPRPTTQVCFFEN